MRQIVLVSERQYRKGRTVFEAADLDVRSAAEGEPELPRAVRETGCRAVIVGVEPYEGELYQALAETGGRGGAIIARFGVGHDNIDKAKARAANVTVTNTPGAVDQSVAEHAVALLLALARKVATFDAAVRRGDWPAEAGVELAGKTLAAIGFGGIGRRVAAIAGLGLGMKVLAVGRRPPAELAAAEGQALGDLCRPLGAQRYTDEADDALARADFVSLHLPANAETRHFIDAQRLGRFKAGAVLVNTARGSVVDEAALYDALAGGRLAGAALDVFESEHPYRPIRDDKDLRTLANVILTPHVGSNTAACNARMAEAALNNCRAFLDGRREGLTPVGQAPGQRGS